jgi:translation initiation factor 2-alpha kinase 4
MEGTEDEEPEADIHLFLPANPKGQSRIQNEFEVLKWLGKGAFGDVFKVIIIGLNMHLVASHA